MANNCWPSVDTHFQSGAGRVSLSLLPIKRVNTAFITICNLLPLRWPKIYNQQSLTLCWHSISRWGREGIAICWPRMAAESSDMTLCNLLVRWLPRMNDQKLLMLHWVSFSRWDRERVVMIFANRGGRYFDLVLPWPNQCLIIRLTWPEIVYPPLTLILPWVYPQYAIIWFGTVHDSHCFGSLTSIFTYFLLDHYIVL